MKTILIIFTLDLTTSIYHTLYIIHHSKIFLVSVLCCCGLCNSLLYEYSSRGVPRIWQGGGQEFFFQIWKFACREATCCAWRSDMLRMAKPCALLGGFGGMLPRENFLKWCNLVRFGVYFDQILSLKNFKNYHFLYKRINILDTRLLWGNYSREEIF